MERSRQIRPSAGCDRGHCFALHYFSLEDVSAWGACLLLVSLFVLLYFLLGLFKHSTEARWTKCFGCCEEEALLGESRAYWDTKKAKNSVTQSRGEGISLSTSDQLEAKEGKTAGHAENPPYQISWFHFRLG